jgi:hypothetical protein
MLGAADNAAIRSAIGLGQTDAPTFLNATVIGLTSTFRAATGTGYSSDFGSGGLGLHTTAQIAWASSFNGFGTKELILEKDAAGILAQRNGTAKQTLRVYNTNLSGAPEWGEFDWITSGGTNTLRIGTNLSGTGTARPIDFVVGGVVRMSISSVVTQISGNVGVSGYISGTLGFGGWFNLSGNSGTHGLAFGSGHMIRWGSATTNSGQTGDLGIGRHADGVAEINNATAGVFRDLRVRSVIQQPPAIIIPASNGDLVVEATNNTLLTFKFKGSDGTVRSGTMVVA